MTARRPHAAGGVALAALGGAMLGRLGPGLQEPIFWAGLFIGLAVAWCLQRASRLQAAHRELLLQKAIAALATDSHFPLEALPAPAWRVTLQKLAGQMAGLRELALRDALTGLANRRAYEAAVNRTWRASLLDGNPFALLMIDLDHFKRINDEAGHLAGDHILRQVATLLADLVPAPGVVARWGGEEFVVLLPSCTSDKAQGLAQALRLHIPHRCGVTASIGLAAFPAHGRTVPDLLAAADRALYAAKSRGRDRCETALAV